MKGSIINKSKQNKKDKKLKNLKEKEAPKKLKKIKKEKPGITDKEANKIVAEEIDQERKAILEKLRERYKYDYLAEHEVIILDAVMTNRSKPEVAQELNLSLSGVYYIISTPHFQKAFQHEMKEKYNQMKRIRKSMYTKIAEKGLNILLIQLEEIEQQRDKHGFTGVSPKDVVAIIEKVINLMQNEDGTQKTNVNLTGGLNNTNISAEVQGTLKDFDLADSEFRKHMRNALVASQPEGQIITRID